MVTRDYTDIGAEITPRPWTLPRVISAGCTNYYAMRMAARLQAMDHPSYEATTRKSGNRHVWSGKTHLLEHTLEIPLTWKKPRLVFVKSMSDLFQDSVPFEDVERVWKIMAEAKIHTFQVLTKQPVQHLRRSVFLQTVGRRKQEACGPHIQRPHVG